MLRIDKVTKTYQMGSVKLDALKNISLEVAKGEFVAIIGPSGSGKSTLMNIVGCLDVPSAGEYYFEDINVSNFNENQLAAIRNKKLGFIFQKFNLLPKLNAFENVELPLIYSGVKTSERKKRVLKALDDVGLSDRIDHKPSELSGGQQQRVAIARALVGNPSLVLADEPTGNLDTKSGKEVLSTLKQLNDDGKTIVLITHDMDVANSAKRIISIQDGLIVDERVL
ncbi:ABC transporter ATP-binding protein [Abyssisolibacter fermentans]|uniref:ABC transporter ATP-binding protein n=1 Tax=Abyssisolibacter fermentans TaxID=1766203 RepID=UPI000829CD46|nr:ABC transporter ATP-binding protein [Abyssisolibacter fermentans]